MCAPQNRRLRRYVLEGAGYRESRDVRIPETSHKSSTDSQGPAQVHLQHVLIFEAVLAEVHQHLAQVQSRLGRHLEAWATLTQAIEALRSPVLAQAIDSWALQHSTR